MAKRTGLGKGLGAIFGEDIVENSETEHVSRETFNGERKTEYKIKLSSIEPNQGQPRKDFNQELISELADSIKKYGVLQPLLVQKKGDSYKIIAGERRWRAAREAGLKEVPVVIKEYTRKHEI